jgi:amino acid permease
MLRASDAATFVNLVNIILGAGILSIPWAFAGASLAGGALVSGVATVWCTFTNLVLIHAAEQEQKFNLGALLSRLGGGRHLELACNVAIGCGNFLACTAYMVIFADCLSALIPVSRGVSIAIGCVVVFPLLYLDQAALAFTSSLSVLANWYIIVLLVGLVTQAEFRRVCIIGAGLGNVTLFSVVVMAVSSQAAVLPMYAEMSERSPHRFAILQVGAGITAWALVVLVAVAGDLRYGLDVSSNVLLDLPNTPSSTFAQFSVLVVVTSTYPMVFYSLTAPLRQRMWKKDPLLRQAHRPRVDAFFAVCLVVDVLAGCAAASGVDLGTVNDYNGVIWTGWFTLLVPAGVYWSLLRRPDANRDFWFVVHLFCGGLTTIACIVWKGNYLVSISENCFMWSI